MSRKLLPAKEKFKIVMLGVSGKYSIAEICNEYGITQGLYYKWRDKLLMMAKGSLSTAVLINVRRDWKRKTASSKKQSAI